MSDYKYNAVKADQIPRDGRGGNRGRFQEWANGLLDDFWQSNDDAWQIIENESGMPINKTNVNKFSVALRAVANKKNKELDGRIIVAQRNGNVYIYAKDENDG